MHHGGTTSTNSLVSKHECSHFLQDMILFSHKCALCVDLFLDFVSMNRHPNVPQKFPRDPGLGRWLARQRLFLRRCKAVERTSLSLIDVERFDLLVGLGLEANGKSASNINFVTVPNKIKVWENQFAELLLLRYKSIHGDCDVPVKSNGEFRSLGRWVTSQRKKYQEFQQSGKGDRSKFRRLAELGFRFKIGSGNAQGCLGLGQEE